MPPSPRGIDSPGADGTGKTETGRVASQETAPLTIVPFYCGSQRSLLEPLAKELMAAFSLPVERQPPGFDPEMAYDSARGQYNSRILLALLLRHHQGPGKLLGVTDADLFIPVLTFVFGEAQLDGRVALVSSHRLVPERYGLPADPAQLQARLAKEAIHELGHTFGLVHCANGRCVMASSPQLTGVDLKTARFCVDCRDALRRRRSRPSTAGP